MPEPTTTTSAAAAAAAAAATAATAATAPPLAQASARSLVEPLPASLLLDRELARRGGLAAGGRLTTGCGELDGHVLLGGLERGSVVGVSAEAEEVGLQIGLQTVARLVATTRSTARAMVVTTLPATVLLPKLREALVGQLSKGQDGLQGLQRRVQGCLERISIARVFDIEGLWEVLGELEAVPEEEGGQTQPTVVVEKRTEIQDSEDEGGLSSPESLSEPETTTSGPAGTSPSTLPDMVLVTHTSALLNALFTGRDKDTAHNTMLLLTSHLHALTRSPSHGGPLIMFLNSTTSPNTFPHAPHTDENTIATAATDGHRPPKPLEFTLRSIFNPPPPPPHPAQAMAGGGQQQQQPGHGSNDFGASSYLAWRNKPSYGPVFSQMLDLHLLCTRVPRTRADSTALAANPGMAVADVAWVWVVEVLLDETGVYEEGDEGGRGWGERRSREQRWGVVDVDGEGRVVDAVL